MTKKLTKADLNSQIFLSDGNKKLRGDDTNAFLVWNIPAISTCLWKTALCELACYARKAEVQYPDVLPCRERNLDESKKESFVADMIKTISWNVTSRKNTQDKQIWFRIHESGDFYSLAYLEKWIDIARQFPNIHFLAYTKAVELIKLAGKMPKNLVIRYSVWSDTAPEQLEIATSLKLPIFTAFQPEILDQKVKADHYTKCLCDCQKCKKCYSKKLPKLAVAIH